ncbi:MAG: hypothetical protein WC578_03775 [Candidatus Omnitrophota bacterium]
MYKFILYFDDKPDMLTNFKTVSDQIFPEFTFRGISDSVELGKLLKDVAFMRQVKVLIFDLAKNMGEEVSHSFEIKADIVSNFDHYRIPIFIHSGFSSFFNDLENKGTIFKIEKSGSSIQAICEKIKLMNDTGFLDLFSSGGILEESYLKELHKAFTEQFRNNEIEEIIKAIKDSVNGDCKVRIQEVFTRIALRSLVHNLTASYEEGADVKEVGLNSVEHYYRRMSAYPVWTGDIFKNKNANEFLFVVTPRCDISRADCTQVLVCKIMPIKTNLMTGEHLAEAINDNARLTSGKFRILSKTPLFVGGQIEYPSHFTLSKENLHSGYDRIITLSDELTNDIVRKFCAYLLRSGVSETELREAKKYLEIVTHKAQEQASPGAGDRVV